MSYNLYYDNEFLESYSGFFIEHTAVCDTHDIHTCNHMLLVYIAHGTGKAFFSQQHLDANEGDIFLINPNVATSFFSTVANRDLSVYCCHFFSDILPYDFTLYEDKFVELVPFFQKETPFIKISDTKQKDIRNLLIRIMDDFTYSQPGYDYAIKNLLNVSIIYIFRIYTLNHTQMDSLNDNINIGYIINYINKRIHSKISLDEVSKMIHLTPQYICRAFKKHTGMTFTQFVNRIRIEKIKDELKHTDRPIYIIYDDFDFTTQYINRVFKKETGYSLIEYKNKFNYKINNPLYKAKKSLSE